MPVAPGMGATRSRLFRRPGPGRIGGRAATTRPHDAVGRSRARRKCYAAAGSAAVSRSSALSSAELRSSVTVTMAQTSAARPATVKPRP